MQLTGAGVDFALSANGSTTQSIAAGGDAVYPLLLTSVAGVPGSVAFSCAGAPAYATCTVNPAQAGLGGSAPITATVTTDVASLQLPMRPGGRLECWLAGLLPLGLLGLGRRRWRRLGGVALLACVMGAAGCGASRLIPLTSNSSTGSGGNPTPAGTYNLVVSGASAGLTRSVGLTLVVQ
jgi:hypothetical protein